MSDLFTDPRFLGLVAAGAVASWLYLWCHLSGRDWRHPAGFLVSLLVVAVFALCFAVFRWGGCIAALAISALGWLGTPLALRLARRR
jgi:hypothetical protein